MQRKCRGTCRDGSPCGSPPMRGGLVCRMHGGSAPQVKAKAAVAVAEKAISDALGKLDIRPVSDPLRALSQVAGEVLAWKELASEYVARLRELSAKNYATGGEEVRADILVFERALDRAIHVLATIAKLNIDERLAAISAEQAKAWGAVLQAVLLDGSLGLSAEQRKATPDVIRRHLASVAS